MAVLDKLVRSMMELLRRHCGSVEEPAVVVLVVAVPPSMVVRLLLDRVVKQFVLVGPNEGV